MYVRMAMIVAAMCVSGIVAAQAQAPQSQQDTAVQPAPASGAFVYYEVPARLPDAAYQQEPKYPAGLPATAALQSAVQPGAKWAAVAVSSHPGKDAYGFDYLKDSAAGAMNAAKKFCEDRLRTYGFTSGQCAVRASQNFVIGLYCRSGRFGYIGEGTSPDAAANDAIAQAAADKAVDCDFKAMRHGSMDKAIFRDAQWNASITCGGRTYNGSASNGTLADNAAIVALNQSFLRCGSRPAGCQVVAYNGPR